jgi:hypothetical protein
MRIILVYNPTGLGPRALYPNTGIHHLTASALNADRVGRIGSFTPSRHFAWFPSSSYPPLSIAQRFLVQSASVDLPPPCSLPIPSRIVPVRFNGSHLSSAWLAYLAAVLHGLSSITILLRRAGGLPSYPCSRHRLRRDSCRSVGLTPFHGVIGSPFFWSGRLSIKSFYQPVIFHIFRSFDLGRISSSRRTFLESGPHSNRITACPSLIGSRIHLRHSRHLPLCWLY